MFFVSTALTKKPESKTYPLYDPRACSVRYGERPGPSTASPPSTEGTSVPHVHFLHEKFIAQRSYSKHPFLPIIRKRKSPAMPNTKVVTSALVISALCFAQTPGPLVLHDGTPVRLRLTRNLSSADVNTGDTVDFEVLEDVKVDDVLVIARGATAIATVTQAQAKRRMGRGGKLDITIDYVRIVNGDKVALKAVKETSGGGHTGAMTGAIVATSLVVWPAAPFFLFMHGKDSTIPKGTEISAYVNGEITLNAAVLSAPAQQPPAQQISPVAATKLASLPSAPNGITVRVTSVPANAEVDLDGNYWGSTPTADLKRLPAGTHTIVVKKIGYQPWERKIDLAAGDDRTINAELEATPVDKTKPRISGLN
jgi:hypothetical protein